MSSFKSKLNNPILIFWSMATWDDFSNWVILEERSTKWSQFLERRQKNFEFLIFHVDI